MTPLWETKAVLLILQSRLACAESETLYDPFCAPPFALLLSMNVMSSCFQPVVLPVPLGVNRTCVFPPCTSYQSFKLPPDLKIREQEAGGTDCSGEQALKALLLQEEVRRRRKGQAEERVDKSISILSKHSYQHGNLSAQETDHMPLFHP